MATDTLEPRNGEDRPSEEIVPAEPAKPAQPAPLASEEVVLAAPASYSGSAQRIWKLTRMGPQDGPLRWAIITGVITLIGLVWILVSCWYLIFGLFVIPYRLIRRGQRKRKMEELRHREQLGAIESRSKPRE